MCLRVKYWHWFMIQIFKCAVRLQILQTTDHLQSAIGINTGDSVRGGWVKFIQSTSMPPLPLHLMFGIKYKGCRVVFFAEFLFKPRNLIFHVHTVQRRLVAMSMDLCEVSQCQEKRSVLIVSYCESTISTFNKEKALLGGLLRALWNLREAFLTALKIIGLGRTGRHNSTTQ